MVVLEPEQRKIYIWQHLIFKLGSTAEVRVVLIKLIFVHSSIQYQTDFDSLTFSMEIADARITAFAIQHLDCDLSYNVTCDIYLNV